MREPDPTDLTFPEVCLGLATAAAAYFAPPLLLLTLPALGLAMMQRVQPDLLPGARQRLLAAPGQVRALVDRVHQHGPRALLGAAPAAQAAETAAGADPASTTTTRQRPAQQAQGPAAAPLSPRAWLHAVNERPDDNPHLTVVGPSGSGKTTFVSAALGKRPGRVIVLTPKVSPGAWRGAEVVTLDDDLSYAPLADALTELQTEAKRRSRALRQGEPIEPLTVVLDELPELHAEIPGAGKFAVRLSRWGRELNVRQVVIATSDDALNIPGWAATRPNYARVELGKPTPDGTRPAWLDDGQSRRPLDLGTVKAGAEQAQLRPWRAVAPAPTMATTHLVHQVDAPAEVAAQPAPPPIDWELLNSLLTTPTPVPTASERPGNAAAVPVPAPTPDGDGNGNSDGGAARSQVIVTPGERGDVRVYVSQTTAVPGTGRARRRGRGLDVRARRQRAQAQRRSDLQRAYYDAGAAGESWRSAYDRLRGHKGTVFADWQQGRKAQGAEGV